MKLLFAYVIPNNNWVSHLRSDWHWCWRVRLGICLSDFTCVGDDNDFGADGYVGSEWGARFKQQQLEGQLYTDLTDTVMGLQDWVLAGRTAELADRQQQDFATINRIKVQQAHFNWWRDFGGAMIIGVVAILLMMFATSRFGGDSFGVNWIALPLCWRFSG